MERSHLGRWFSITGFLRFLVFLNLVSLTLALTFSFFSVGWSRNAADHRMLICNEFQLTIFNSLNQRQRDEKGILPSGWLQRAKQELKFDALGGTIQDLDRRCGLRKIFSNGEDIEISLDEVCGFHPPFREVEKWKMRQEENTSFFREPIYWKGLRAENPTRPRVILLVLILLVWLSIRLKPENEH